MGLLPTVAYQSSEALLTPKDLVLLFTDGLVEVENPANDLYHPGLLAAAVQKRLQLPASELFDELLAEIRRFSENAGFSDDVCLVGMEMTQG
jgi:serine phosphatase RsbU (regulator of sigma subunit)